MSSTIFSIDQYRLTSISSANGINFFRNLLWCEAQRVGLSPYNVVISLDDTTPDGGIDAKVDGHLSVDSILMQGPNYFQIKTGNTFKPWQKRQIEKELFGKKTKYPYIRESLGSAVRECLDNKGRYFLIVFGHDLTSKQQSDSRRLLEESFKQIGYPSPLVEVIGVGQIIGLTTPFPSLCLDFLERSDLNFKSIDTWKMSDDMKHTPVLGPLQDKFIQEVRDILANNKFWGYVLD